MISAPFFANCFFSPFSMIFKHFEYAKMCHNIPILACIINDAFLNIFAHCAFSNFHGKMGLMMRSSESHQSNLEAFALDFSDSDAHLIWWEITHFEKTFPNATFEII